MTLLGKKIDKARKLVEAVLRDHKMDPDKLRVSASEGGAAWAGRFGSAAVMIALNPAASNDRPGQLRIISPIVKVAEDWSSDVFKKLLAMNGTELRGAAFGLVGGEIVLVAERSVRGLDRTEVEEMLAIVAYYADKYDDLLVKQFGGIRVCDLD